MPGGWSYRVDYPYYSWAQTVVRPSVKRRDFRDLLARLNELESAAGSWKEDSSEMTSAFKFTNERRTLVASNLQPDVVAQLVGESLRANLASDGSVRQAVV